MKVKSNDINTLYKGLCYNLRNFGSEVNNTLELTNVVFQLEDINNCIISLSDFNPSLRYLLAENLWYSCGSNDLKFISNFAKKWAEISDDGVTSNSAYGYIMQYKFGFNQINKVIDILNKDKYSRRACIIINDANENVDTTKDEQCTMYLQFMIRNDKLDLTVNMRSNDIRYGLPYDVPAFIGLQKYIAFMLDVGYGTYTHFAGSLHCYKEDYMHLDIVIGSNYRERKRYIDLLRIWLTGFIIYDDVKKNPKDIIKIMDEYIKE